ncbi:TetR/AcrR family transcriptional regulator [Nocardia veterana]|uniref:TetR/AcrR family transcriptional regulator n=1 Tax=Nocardia veterana TaxID=132249 RepID=A0A7X6LTY4_9NOCA|nr:TetR/AcrR family transcriptional regulator [Nocardia veterana]NKY84029.1 TetR/AcrR family transcriptional regulator [Nocardia veterana]
MSEVKTSRREMYAALTKSAILEAAKKLFVERGYDDTSVDDIARAANVSKGAVYHHFRDKREMFAQVYRETTAAVSTVVAQEVLRVPADSWQRMEVAATTAIRAYARDPQARALLQQVTRVLGDEQTKEIELEYALPLIQQLFEEMNRVGELARFDTEVAAQLAFRVLCEASLIVAAAADPDAASQRAETVMLLMLGGLKK